MLNALPYTTIVCELSCACDICSMCHSSIVDLEAVTLLAWHEERSKKKIKKKKKNNNHKNITYVGMNRPIVRSHLSFPT